MSTGGFRFGEDRDPPDAAPTVGKRGLMSWPRYELAYLFSARDHPRAEPREITILPPTDLENNYTEWISADADAAVDVREAV